MPTHRANLQQFPSELIEFLGTALRYDEVQTKQLLRKLMAPQDKPQNVTADFVDAVDGERISGDSVEAKLWGNGKPFDTLYADTRKNRGFKARPNGGMRFRKVRISSKFVILG